MKLPSYQDLPVGGKKVLLRVNFDVPLAAGEVADASRIEESLPTINYLREKKAHTILVSHLGRPGGKRMAALTLKPVAEKLSQFLGQKVFLTDKMASVNQPLVMLENLRFNPGEEANDLEFARSLVTLGDFFVNDAFACSHREHASIVGLPRFLPSAFGADFLKEVAFLTKVRTKPTRPVVLILGGVKKDKLQAAKKLASWVDWILLGGKLVKYQPNFKTQTVMGELTKDGQDITSKTAAQFAKIIAGAKTVIWAGPLGNIYDGEHALGTKMVAQAVVQSQAISVIGGGDTEAALTQFGLVQKINFICSGGGAMLEFLAEGTLPGIKAVING